MKICYIGLGSNLDHPIWQVQTAISQIADIPKTKLLKTSSLYQTQPVGPQNQPLFINAVIQISTALSASDLFRELQKIENLHDRKRTEKWGPRTLDLDLLLYGKEKIHTSNLIVPHPEIQNRSFVLDPLKEIDPFINIDNM